MKKLFSFLVAAAALGFTACEDVPAPYEINDGGNTTTPGKQESLFETSFDNGSTGGFSFSNTNLGSGLSYVWSADSYGYLKASAYASSAAHASEAWAVSPAINLGDCTKATLSFRHAINKLDDLSQMDQMMTLWVCTDYAGDASTASWTQLSIPTYPAGDSWTFVGSGDIDLTDYCGQEAVYVGFKYISTDAIAGSWEVDEFKITGDGTPTTEPDTPENPDTPIEPSGDNLLTNGDFEAWTGSTPDNWKSACSASNATLSQSTDAHSGSYSVLVGGATSANKRLAYKELTLKAGTYTETYYVKAASATGASIRPGYAVVPATGSLSGDSYIYGDYVNNISSTAWTAVTYEFTLDAETTVCLVMMNGKNPGGDILVDDFSLTTANGGIAGGTTTEPDPTPAPTPGDDAIFSADFTSDLGGFTVEDKTLPAGLTTLWKQETYQSSNYAKASGYNNGGTDSEGWLISPVIDLTGKTAATLTFSHAGKFFGTPENEATVWAKAEGGEWTKLTIDNYFTNTSWTFVDASVSLNAFAGKKMQIAFVYKSTTAATGTWEVSTVRVK